LDVSAAGACSCWNRGGTDFLLARQWLQELASLPLRSGDALHRAIAEREKLRLATADKALIRAAAALGLNHQAIGNSFT